MRVGCVQGGGGGVGGETEGSGDDAGAGAGHGAEKEEETEKRKAREMRGRGRRMVGGSVGGVGDMDDVGRGWNLDGEEALFEGVPVGIREFMATEKRLKERREREEREERGKGVDG